MMISTRRSGEKNRLDYTICTWPTRCEKCEDRDRCPIMSLVEENELLKEEIRVSRESAEITASLVVQQFEETECILQRFQVANAQRKAVLDSATHMAIIATDQHGTIVVFNKGAERMLGYSAAEVVGQLTPLPFHDMVELGARVKSLSEEIGQPFEKLDLFFHYALHQADRQREWTYQHKNGFAFPVNLSISPLRDTEGILSGFLCIAEDITEKKRSEKALRESERDYRLLIDNIPNIVFKGYRNGTIDFFDDKIEVLTGYPKELFLNRTLKWTDLILDEDLQAERDRFIVAQRSDQQYIREYRIRRKDGNIVWLQASGQVVRDLNGEIDFISGAFLNITKRKRAEAALQESEEKYRSLFDSGPNPIFVLDARTLQILDVNPAAIDTYGYSKGELIDRRFDELGEFEIQAPEPAAEKGAGWVERCFVEQKVRHCKKDGTLFYLRIKACPIKYGDRHAIILAATDITEAMEKDAQLFQATKMKTLGEMSAGMAHELTQPLNAIKIGNDFLRRMIRTGQTISTRDLDRVALSVTGQVNRASAIINHLREFGRNPDFKKEPVDLNVVIKNVIQIVGQQLALNNIEVIFNLDKSLPAILANANRLEQVVFNLVSNARDAIDQSPASAAGSGKKTITLSTFVESNTIVCAIEDTGTGIAGHARDKIFEPFFTTKEVGCGMGLGLAISYGIVRDYGGTIDVSNTPSGGACFALRFPQL
jgi:PAS domain S-box-containing protein